MSTVAKPFSYLRVAVYALVIGLPVFGLIAGLMLPRFLKLETYRPEILDQIQRSSGRRMSIGALHAEYMPPSVAADKIVVLELDPPYRPILTADRISLHLRLRSLLKGKLDIYAAEIERPRVIIYTNRLGVPRPMQSAPTPQSRGSALVVLIHHGRIDLDGPLFGKTIRWGIDNVEGKVDEPQRRITLSANPTFFGPSVHVNVTLDPDAQIPVRAELINANLDQLYAVLGATRALSSRTSINGTFEMSTDSIRGTVDFTGLTSAMTAEGRYVPRGKGWDASAQVNRYSPEIARLFLANRWIQSLEGPGSLVLQAKRRGTRQAQFSLVGSSFTFSGTRLEVPFWSAFVEGDHVDVAVKARTPDKEGQVGVKWTQSSSKLPGMIHVTVSSVNVRDVFDVFAVHPSSPIGIEAWKIQQGLYSGHVDPEGRIRITNAELTFQELKLKTMGEINTSTVPALAHFKGTLSDVQLSPVLASLGASPAPLSGVAKADFTIHFPLEAHWLEHFSGQAVTESRDGFVHAGKILYRIAGVLNLTNVLNPSGRDNTTKAGFPYDTASGTANVTQGVVQTQDLKIRTKNMDIGGRGELNLPAKLIDARLELQLMNVVKDTLSKIPVVKRVVVKDSGFIRIPVRIHGKMDNPEVD